MPAGMTFNVDTLEMLTSFETYGRALVELAERDPRIVLLTADLSRSTRAIDFFKAFPERSFNLGIAEQNMLGVAAGLSASGYLPFAINIATFQSMRSYEQIRTDFGYPCLPGVFLTVWWGLSGGYVGATHHGMEDLALMRLIPNMTVLAPANTEDTSAAVRAAAKAKGPVYIRLSQAMDLLGTEEPELAVGKGIALAQGRDLTIVACGPQVIEAKKALGLLEEKKISAGLLYLHTIKPLDAASIESAARATGAMLTVEDHTVNGGLGGAVAETLAEAGLGIKFRRLGIPDTFSPIGYADELYRHFGLDAEGIAKAAEALLRGPSTGGG